jgi:hypothetical protein
MKTKKKRLEDLEAKSMHKKQITLIKDVYKPLWFCYVEKDGKRVKEYMTETEAIKAYSGHDITWIDNTETRRKRIEKANEIMETKK